MLSKANRFVEIFSVDAIKKKKIGRKKERFKRLLRIEYNVVTLYSAYTVDFLFFNCLNDFTAYVVVLDNI